ncbi:unnamed protein product, partial [Mesorhabditis spiculigera]
MGQTLSEPVTTKESASCSNKIFSVGSSCMQGWRTSMEDAHTHLLSLPEDPKTAFFAVYDGHGGPKVSQYAGIHLHHTIASQPEFKDGDLPLALKKGFLALDEKMRADDEMKDDVSGTTAVVVMVQRDTIYCANVGDSRAIVSVCGEAVPLSYDHKPANEKEAKRIIAAGGFVEYNRVNGNLALSRALGDFIFKNINIPPEDQVVTANPDVEIQQITDDHEFIVVACDGIWDVMNNQEVADFCRDRLAKGREPQLICEELLNRCLSPDAQMAGLGCDNMTVVLISITKGLDEKAFMEKCSRPSRYKPVTDEEENDGLDVTKASYLGDENEPTTIQDALHAHDTYETPQPSPNPAVVDDDEKPPSQFTAA